MCLYCVFCTFKSDGHFKNAVSGVEYFFYAKSVFCVHKTAFCIIASEMDIALRVTIQDIASGI